MASLKTTSLVAAASVALVACAPAAQGVNVQPDLGWMEDGFGWVSVTEASAPPARLVFGVENTDWILIMATCADTPGDYNLTYFNAADERDGAAAPVQLSGDAGQINLDGRIYCEESEIGPECVTEAKAGGALLSDLLASEGPIRITAADQVKWFPAPGAEGAAFIQACRSHMAIS